jgi:Tol biopolymer transport system component
MNADGTNEIQILGDTNDQPAWTPDGTRIVYEHTPDGTGEIWTMNPDGTNQTLVLPTPTDEPFPRWQPIP